MKVNVVAQVVADKGWRNMVAFDYETNLAGTDTILDIKNHLWARIQSHHKEENIAELYKKVEDIGDLREEKFEGDGKRYDDNTLLAEVLNHVSEEAIIMSKAATFFSPAKPINMLFLITNDPPWLKQDLETVASEREADIEGYLTTAEVAERLGVAQTTVREWCQKRLLVGAVKAGTGRRATWLIPLDALAKFTPPRGPRPRKKRAQ